MTPDADAPTPTPSDRDRDGLQDTADIDLDKDGKPDLRNRPIFEFGGRRYVDAGAVAPDTIPPLPDVIKTQSEYDVSAVTRPLREMVDFWKRNTLVGVAFAFAIGFAIGAGVAIRSGAAPTPVDASSREALYQQIRDSLRDESECRAVRVAMGLEDKEQH